MKSLLRAVFFSIFILYSPYIWQRATGEFRLGKLAFDLPYNAVWKTDSAQFNKPIGKFSYLAHGAQSFVFQSEDRQWTLKLFRHDRWIHPWRKMIRNEILQKKKRLAFDQKIDRLFCSTRLAFEQVPDLTGLVYVHLNRTEHLPSVILIDSVGREQSLDLNRTYFVIQRRADPIKQVLLEAVQAGDQEYFKRLSRSFVQLLNRRTAKGIRNSDTKVAKNFGIWKDQVIEWDFGNYWIDPEMTTEVARLSEINRFIFQPERWLKNFPEWVEIYRRETEDLPKMH